MNKALRDPAIRAGWIQPDVPVPPLTQLPGQYLPGQYLPGQYLPGQYLPGQYLPGQYPPAPALVPQARLDRVSPWWAVVPIISGGFLAFLPFLRVASARRQARDWRRFWGYLIADLGLVTLSGVVPDRSAVAPAIQALTFIMIAVATVHSIIEIRSLPRSAPSLAAPYPAPYPLPYQAPDPVAAARARIARRSEARQLASKDPVLARELRIGRPDLARQFDDGGLIDVNNVPPAILAEQLQLTSQEVDAVLAARAQLGKFTSPEEFSVYAQLAPARVDAIRDLLWFG